MVSVYQRVFKLVNDIGPLRDFFLLFADDEMSQFGLCYNGYESVADWRIGLTATKLMVAALDALRATGQLSNPASATLPANDAETTAHDEVRKIEFRIFFPSAVLSRAFDRSLKDLKPGEDRDSLLQASEGLKDAGRFGVDTCFSLILRWGTLGKDIEDQSVPPLLILELVVWSYRPASRDFAPPDGTKRSSPTRFDTNKVAELLGTIYPKLEDGVDTMRSRAGLSVTEIRPYMFFPPIHFLINLVDHKSLSTFQNLRKAVDEFAPLLQDLLKGGETQGALLEGELNLFRKNLPDPKNSKIAVYSLYVPVVDLIAKPEGVTDVEASFEGLAAQLSYYEFWLLNHAHIARVEIERIECERRKIRKGGTTLRKLEDWRKRSKRALDYLRSATNYSDDNLAGFSFDALPGFPNAKNSLLRGSFGVKAFEAAYGGYESDLSKELAERLAMDTYNTESAVHVLTYAALVGAFVLAILPVLIEREWSLTLIQFETITGTGAILLFVIAILMLLHRKSRL